MEITKFYQSIAEVQLSIGALVKDAKNDYYQSKYFDVNQLINQLRPLLAEHRLLLLQPVTNGKVYSQIIAIDNPEFMIESYIDLPDDTNPQKIGSCISYYRRYSLVSLMALEAEDDDGNKASTPTKAKPAKQEPIALTDEQINSSISKGTQSKVLDGIVAGKYTATEDQIMKLQTA